MADDSKNRTYREEAGLRKRILRYGRLGGTVAGLAGRMAAERYLGIKIEREDHARELMHAFGNLRGPVMKIGQILATIPQALPAEYAETFGHLQANAPPMGRLFVKRRMRGELGEDWQYRFSSFNEEASAAASLGQVHKAVSREGRELACKLQYPDMASAIDTDLRQLKTIFSIYEKYDNAIYTRYIHEELQERLFEEIDYFLEARHCRLFRYMLGKEKNVSVPEVEENLSTQRLLTTEWLEGTPVLSYTDAPAEQRNRIALNMFRAWYVPFYYYGAIHGDPHLGNYSVNDDDSINLLDFGCVRTFRPEFVGGVIDLYNALLENDVDLAAHAYETWGFTGLSRDQIDILNIWARFLYAPLLEDGVRPIGLVTEGVYGRETAAEVHRKLREYGRVSVPREFVFMDRAALGLGSVFLHLKAEINWHRLFNEMIEDFDIEAMRLRQNETFSKFEISPPD